MRTYSYASIIRDAQRARWSLDQVSASVHDLDFSRPFLPRRLVHVAAPSLEPDLDLAINHVRAHSYLRFFALVERFILPFAMLHAANAMNASAERLLALMQFGEEEAKHIALFERFSQAFEFGFGSHCEVVGPSDAVADEVLAQDPLAVGLLVLHIEWMTQEHFTASVRGRTDIDPPFASLLRHHWMEEAQHARLDTLILDEMAAGYAEHRRQRALESYLALLDRIDALLGVQVDLDFEALDRVGFRVEGEAKDQLREDQLASYREVFLRAGLDHPRVREFIRGQFGDRRERLDSSSSRWKLDEP